MIYNFIFDHVTNDKSINCIIQTTLKNIDHTETNMMQPSLLIINKWSNFADNKQTYFLFELNKDKRPTHACILFL